MKRVLTTCFIIALAASVGTAQNLLLNGNFNSPNSVAPPDNWSVWSFGMGYSNHEILTTQLGANAGNYDGSYQMSLGAANTSGGGGVYQAVAATAGLTYELSVDAGAEAWWLPTGEIRLFFLDAGDNQLGLTQINTTDGIHAPDLYDVGVVYQNWGFTAVAPVGTTQAKVEFAGFGGGSTWFDNASLTIVPEPSSFALLGIGMLTLLARRARRSAPRTPGSI